MPVDTTHPGYDARVTQWQRCRDFIEGEDAVKHRGQVYLPALAGQETSQYTNYKNRAAFFNGAGRGASGLHGLVFRKAPIMELPASMEYMADDATMTGVGLSDFANQVFQEVVDVGRVGVLVDYPTGMGQPLTLADAEMLGRRPYLTYYPAESIINWAWTVQGGISVLRMVVLEDDMLVPDPDDPFEMLEKTQYRVLSLEQEEFGVQYRVTIYESQPSQSTQGKQVSGRAGQENIVPIGQTVPGVSGPGRGGSDIVEINSYIPTINGRPLNYIPFKFIQSTKSDMEVAKPPLLDLVNVNMAHYRNSADYEHGLHFCGLPTPVIVSGEIDPEEEVAIGGETAILLKDGSAFFLEFQGEGLKPMREAMHEKEQKMGTLGLRMLLPDRVQSETAETARIYRIGEHSILAAMARNTSFGIEQALRWAAAWQGTPTAEFKFELNLDYFPTELSPQALLELGRAATAGTISSWDLFDALKAGEVVRHDKTYDIWQSELEKDREARQERMEADLALQQPANSGNNVPPDVPEAPEG